MSEKRDYDYTEEIVDTENGPAFDSEGEESLVAAEDPKKLFADALDWMASLVYAILVMLTLNLFVFRSITVSGDSMNNTLQNLDRVIATNLFYTPQRGDIVVLQADLLQPAVTAPFGEPIIKRVIAVEGDKIRFDFTAGEVYVNDEQLEEDYIAQPTFASLNIVEGREYTVPDGCVFVMGDNRNASTDSRDFRVGMVDTDYIMGKAVFRFAPFDSIGLL